MQFFPEQLDNMSLSSFDKKSSNMKTLHTTSYQPLKEKVFKHAPKCRHLDAICGMQSLRWLLAHLYATHHHSPNMWHVLREPPTELKYITYPMIPQTSCYRIELAPQKRQQKNQRFFQLLAGGASYQGFDRLIFNKIWHLFLSKIHMSYESFNQVRCILYIYKYILDLPTCPVRVTTRIITVLVGNPYQPL